MGTVAPGELPRLVSELGFDACALMDHNNLYGAVEFYESALANNIKPMIGAEVTCPQTGLTVGIIALSRQGYSNLCRIITRRNLEPETTLVESVAAAAGDIAILAPDLESAQTLLPIVGRDRLWVEIVANRLTRSKIRNLIKGAKLSGLTALASWEVRFASPQDEPLGRVLASIAAKDLVSNTSLDVVKASVEDLPSLAKPFGDMPEALHASRDLAAMASLDLELGKVHFPRIEATDQQALRVLETTCSRMLATKYPSNRTAAQRRLRSELNTIAKLGLANYFLVVKNIVDFATERGIPVAGRGSGAGSLVAYLLGITQVDPIREHLLFERFLNEHRPDYPDLDIDICWRRRDEVIEYVYDRFGRARTAMVATHARFELRSAAREVAKAFGLSPYESQALAVRLPWKGDAQTILKALRQIRPELPLRTSRRIARLAAACIGLPHHTSVHCGGIVIADRPITDYSPLEIAPKGIQVTQLDMHAIEKMGLVKIDLLGNRALTVIDETLRDVGKTWRNPARRPADRKTADLLSTGRTLSCFQLESPAMRTLLKMLKATKLDDVTLALALVRPGPSACGMKDAFVRRRLNGGGNTRDLKGHVLVYEEDVMRTISHFTGLTLAEADILRREIKAATEAVRDEFIALVTTAGYSRSTALKIWSHLERFASYAFSKAHAASYAVLASATAYLKANHPVEFYASILRNHAGMYPIWVHVNEARRLGVKVLPPDINRSEAEFSVEAGAIRTGLLSVKHVSRNLVEAILAERKRRPFESLLDFLNRVSPSRDEVASLVGSGAFDDLEPSRSACFAACLISRSTRRDAEQLGLALGASHPRIGVPDLEDVEKWQMQYAVLGFCPSVHPLVLFREDGVSESVEGKAKGLTRLTGLLAATRHYETKRSDLYFLTLDHPTGVIECVLPTHRLNVALEIGKAYAVMATPSTRNGTTAWRVSHIARLEQR